MPWEEKTVEETRAEFIARAMSGEQSKSALCREYGISRPTAYKWIERYLNGENLSDHSRRPFHSPQRIDPIIEAAIIQMRRMYPALGAKKIHRMMLNDGVLVPPAVSTINAVLKRNGLISREASLAATPYSGSKKNNRTRCGRQISRETLQCKTDSSVIRYPFWMITPECVFAQMPKQINKGRVYRKVFKKPLKPTVCQAFCFVTTVIRGAQVKVHPSQNLKYG